MLDSRVLDLEFLRLAVRDSVGINPDVGPSDAMRAKMRAVFDNLLRHTRGEPLMNVMPELADLSLSARG
jgi:hypothetical protein